MEFMISYGVGNAILYKIIRSILLYHWLSVHCSVHDVVYILSCVVCVCVTWEKTLYIYSKRETRDEKMIK